MPVGGAQNVRASALRNSATQMSASPLSQQNMARKTRVTDHVQQVGVDLRRIFDNAHGVFQTTRESCRLLSLNIMVQFIRQTNGMTRRCQPYFFMRRTFDARDLDCGQESSRVTGGVGSRTPFPGCILFVTLHNRIIIQSIRPT